MKKINIEKLDLPLYYEKLENGLDVYIIPKNNVNNIYTTFSTKYGSNQIEFIPINEKKMTKVPLGIAHFLEHKLFEQSDGIDPFTFYSERGCDANANTSQFKTTFLFSGPSFVYENLEYLLDYVQSPYFTDENVEKEKGIIIQEIKMYQDDPGSVLFESIIKNTFVNHPMKEPIIGNIESVISTTKEDLYTCYNTFYHPSNMFVVITGNVEPDKIIETIKINQNKKDYKNSKEIKQKKYEEPNKVAMEHEEVSLNVAINKSAIAYKIKIEDIDNLYEYLLYLITFFDIKFGGTSLFTNNLIKDKIINNDLFIDFTNVDKHAVVIISGTSKQPNELLNKIKEEVKDIKVSQEEFERKKKTLLSSLIYMSDNIFSLNHLIMNSIIKYGKFNPKRYEIIKNLNYNDFNKIIKNINFSNYTTFIVNPKD